MKPKKNIIIYTVVFYEEEPELNTFGSNNIIYEIQYSNGIMSVWKVGAFGDRTLINNFRDRRAREITLQEMLENIQEISNMELEDFKKIIGEKND